MKNLIFIFFLTSLFSFSCTTSDYLFKETPKSNFEKLNVILDKYKDSSLTYFDFQNLRSKTSFVNSEYFLIKGKILDMRNGEFLFYADPIINESFGYFYITNDNPLPRQTNNIYFGVNSQITLIGKLINIETYALLRDLVANINNERIVFKGEEFVNIPKLKGIVIYSLQDFELTNPLWVSTEVLELYDNIY